MMKSTSGAPSLPYSVPIGDPFQALFGVCRSEQCLLIAKDEVDSVLVGEPRGRRHIIVASYLAYLERQREREAAGTIGRPSPNPRGRKRNPRADDRSEPPPAEDEALPPAVAEAWLGCAPQPARADCEAVAAAE